MPIVNFIVDKATVVALSPAIRLANISIDRIRAVSGSFVVGSFGDRIVVGSPLVEYPLVIITEGRIEFSSRTGEAVDSDGFIELVDKVSQAVHAEGVDTTAIGTNYLVSFEVPGAGSGGTYIRDRFLRGQEKIAAMWDKPLISSATRMVFGDVNNFDDLKIHPLDLTGKKMGSHYHVHNSKTLPLKGIREYVFDRLKSEPAKFQGLLGRVIDL